MLLDLTHFLFCVLSLHNQYYSLFIICHVHILFYTHTNTVLYYVHLILYCIVYIDIVTHM